MAKKATTLFIRDTGIYLLVMKGKQVDRWATSPLEPGLVSQGLILDEDAVAEQVRDLFKQEKVGMTKVIVGLSGHDSLYRIITLPDVPDAVLPEAVRREARRTIPTPLDEIYYAYQPVPSMKGERRVFLATYPRNAVDTLVGTLRKAGIRPYVMDLAPIALSRIPDVPRSIIVNGRLDHLEVMIIAERMPQVIRRLSLPGESESLEEKLLLFTEGFSRTVTFYNSSHMETPLDPTVPVFVCGDLAEAPDTWQTLLGEREHPVSALPMPVEAPEEFNADPFMVNVGLALKELQPDKQVADFSIVNFNALPETYQPKHFSIARVLVPVGLVIGIGAIAFAGIMMLTNRAQIAELRPQVTAAETRVADLQRDIATLRGRISAMGPAADALNTRISTMEMGRAAIAMDLSEINTLAGTRVQLSTVNHGGGSVNLQGSTSSADAVYDFADALRTSDRFSGVWVRSVTVSGNQHTFAFDVYK